MFNDKYKQQIKLLEAEIKSRDDRIVALAKSVKEQSEYISTHEEIYCQLDNYKSIETATEDRYNECEYLSKKIIEAQRQLESIQQDLADNQVEIYKDILDCGNYYFTGFDPDDYEDEIERLEAEVEWSNQDVFAFMHSGEEGTTFDNQTFGKFQLTESQLRKVTKSMQDVICWCFHYKCCLLQEKLNGANLEAYITKVIKFKERLEAMFAPIKLEIFDNVLDTEVRKFRAINRLEEIKRIQKDERKRQADEIKEQQRMEREIQQEEHRIKQALQKCKDEEEIQQLNQQLENVYQRKENPRAGYLYIIDNPDMKDGMLKLGITRRINWMERISELSDASHSFQMNVYGIVYSQDVFKLETSIHRYFAEKRVNQINPRKEWFYVNLDEVEIALTELGHPIKLKRDIQNDDYTKSIQILHRKGFIS